MVEAIAVYAVSPGAALCCIDTHGQYVEDHAAHDDAVISRRHGMGVLIGTAELNDLVCKSYRQGTDENCCRDAEHDGHDQDLVSCLLPFFPETSRHQGGNCHIRRDEQCQSQELRLCGQTDRRHRICSQGTHHESIHHTCQCDKKGFTDRRPCQPDRFFRQGTLCVFSTHILTYLITFLPCKFCLYSCKFYLYLL